MSRRSRPPRIRLSELREFLVEAKTRIHAALAAPVTSTTRAHAKHHTYGRAPFRYEDEYLGDNVDIGQEIVWYSDVPIWGMGCHGGILREFVQMRQPVFAFLRQALMQPDPVCPVRGPGRLDRDGFVYVNHVTGDVQSFVGREAVYWRDRLVCFYDYVGGGLRGTTAADVDILAD